MARIDEVGIECSLDTCGGCYYHHLMAQVARDLLAGDACVGTVQAWSDELQHRWEDGPFFRLWTEEKAAGRDPRCAFRERGWTP